MSRRAAGAGASLVAILLLVVEAHGQPARPVEGASAVAPARIASIFAALDERSATDSVVALYGSLGYLSARIAVDSLRITVDEGRQYRLTSQSIVPDSAAAILELDSLPVDGVPFSTGLVNEWLAQAVDAAMRHGYPLARARVADLDVDDSAATVRLVIAIDRLEPVVISEVDVRGNSETQRWLILAAAGVHGGELFTEAFAARVRSRLERLDLFADVAVPQLYRTDSGRYGLLLIVTEGRPNAFDGVLGFQPPTESEPSGALVGRIDIVLRNLFGGGRGISIGYERSRPTERIDVRYLERFVLGLPVDVEIGYLQRQEAATSGLPGYVQRVIDGVASYGFLETWSLLAGGVYDETIPERDSTRSCAQSLFNSRTLRSSLGVAYDSRDYVLSPTSGVLFKTGVTLGNKVVRSGGSCPDSLVPGSELRQRTDVDVEAFASPLHRVVLRFGAHYGEVRGEVLESSDLLRMGGQSTTRGYREDQFRSARRAWLTVEPRLQLSRDSFVGAFVDAGYTYRPADRFSGAPENEAWLLGYGVAAQISTPLGLASVSYGLSRDDTFETGKIFFGLLNRF